MLKYTSVASSNIEVDSTSIASFIKKEEQNIDWKTVESFGNEWSIFNSFDDEEVALIGNDYFDILPPQLEDKHTVALDAGCGSGRWSKFLSDKVGFIEAIDPSSAVFTAVKLLKGVSNVRVTQASIDHIPFEDNSFDLVFSLGVLHHIPDTRQAISRCVAKVKPGGYFLVYLYYDLDNRGFLYKIIFKISNMLRKVISRLPAKTKVMACNLIAVSIYGPLVYFCRFLDKINVPKRIIDKIPLSYYRKTSFTIIKNDALDRFGTPLEKRFSKVEIGEMMHGAGLSEITFSSKAPFWHAIGRKK